MTITSTPPVPPALIKSRERVRDLAEVYTAQREVDAMLDLFGDESYRIEARVLEPACGNGNFLHTILERKLSTVSKNYEAQLLKSARNAKRLFEYQTLLALTNVYGIDISAENVVEARERLLKVVEHHYSSHINTTTASSFFWASVVYVLEKNLLIGDTINGAAALQITDFNYGKKKKYFFTCATYLFSDLSSSTTPFPLSVDAPKQYDKLNTMVERQLEFSFAEKVKDNV